MEDLTIHVLLPNGEKITYQVPINETVGYLVNLMKKDEKVEIPHNRIISIIYRGRILGSDEILSHFDSLREFSVHAFFKIDPSATENEEGTSNNENVEFHELRGFDRLRRMNLSADQIAVLRRNFHTLNNTIDSPIDAQIDLEEEWLPTIFNQPDYLAILQQANLGLFGNVSNGPNNNNEQQNDGNTNNNTNNNNDRTSQANQNDDLDDPDMQIPIGDCFWLPFAFGFITGLIFGVVSLLVVLVFYRRAAFLVGLLMGISLNFYLTLV